MRIIAVANQKGGCGKTTTAINLASSLTRRGKKVLLVDFDPQAHATLGLNQDPSGLEKTIYHALSPAVEGETVLSDVLLTVKENFDLAPSGILLSALEHQLAGKDGRETRLLWALEELEGSYDYVLIDCPPSIGLLCINALRACHEVIIPIDMSLFSLRGVAKLTEIVLLLKENLGHEIRPRALVTMFDFRTRYAKQVLEKVKESFGRNVFESVIRYNIRLRETVDHGLPIGDYDKRSIGNLDYENLADEVVSAEQQGLRPEEGELLSAREILEHTEDYIERMTTLAREPATEPDEEPEEIFSSGDREETAAMLAGAGEEARESSGHEPTDRDEGGKQDGTGE
jgi:chromosome partitioning protein